MKKKKNKKWLVALIVVAVIIVASIIGINVYASDSYSANQMAHEALKGSSDVTVSYLDDDTIIFTPDTITAGLIFYPGGKVEYDAYAPLMMAFAENGYLCILPKMPLNLAVLSPEAASKYIDGGCHAYFGSYGEQDGDGTPTITNAEQIQTTVDLLTH